MAHSSTFIDGSLPISLGTINSVLVAGSNDLVTLCSYSGINKWAKYKPIDVGNQNTDLTDAQRKNYNYGLGLGSAGYTSGDPTSIVTETWTYQYRPTTTDCCRVGDFGNYKKDAVQPLESAGTLVTRLTSNTCFDVYVNEDDYGYAIKLEDLTLLNKSLDDWYFCVLFVGKDSNNDTCSYVTTAPDTIGDQVISVSGGYLQAWGAPPVSNHTGTYTWYALMCDQKIEGWKTVTAVKNAGSYYFAALPFSSADDAKGTVNVKSGEGTGTGGTYDVALYAIPLTDEEPFYVSPQNLTGVRLEVTSTTKSVSGKSGTLTISEVTIYKDDGGQLTAVGTWNNNGNWVFTLTNGAWDKTEMTVQGTDTITVQNTEYFGKVTGYVATGDLNSMSIESDTESFLEYGN